MPRLHASHCRRRAPVCPAPAAANTRFPYWGPPEGDADGGPGPSNWTGYLRPILDHICGPEYGLECELVFFTDLPDRIAMLQNVG